MAITSFSGYQLMAKLVSCAPHTRRPLRLPTPRIFKSKFWTPCHFICIVNISECVSIRENSLKYLELSYQKPNSLTLELYIII